MIIFWEIWLAICCDQGHHFGLYFEFEFDNRIGFFSTGIAIGEEDGAMVKK